MTRLEEIKARHEGYIADPMDEYEGDPDVEWLLKRVQELERTIQYVLDCDMAEREFDAQRLMDVLNHAEPGS